MNGNHSADDGPMPMDPSFSDVSDPEEPVDYGTAAAAMESSGSTDMDRDT
eukprot:CAMPEP_0197732100 /NCGR_PEP_ID=MMETSP1434-20131217/39606_1 /TAXON_ID=265543 /ORGANISM="Minutocellus polymorphus, Strain CCMP3303" /LENGTH=49 /DNA_ID= /DNA_START= /DNA_END= /DNA_ORIENTATION=